MVEWEDIFEDKLEYESQIFHLLILWHQKCYSTSPGVKNSDKVFLTPMKNNSNEGQ